MGGQFLRTLLNHYGSRKIDDDGKAYDPLVQKQLCYGEFLPFKREVYTLRKDEDSNVRRPAQLMEAMFGGQHTRNRTNFKGKS